MIHHLQGVHSVAAFSGTLARHWTPHDDPRLYRSNWQLHDLVLVNRVAQCANLLSSIADAAASLNCLESIVTQLKVG
jgi:hypothetical protein